MYLLLGCSIKCTPNNYGGTNVLNENEGIIAGKFPICNYIEDYYSDWLLTNSASLNVQKTSSAVTTGLGFLTFAGAIITALVTGGLTLPIARSSFRWFCYCLVRCYSIR